MGRELKRRASSPPSEATSQRSADASRTASGLRLVARISVVVLVLEIALALTSPLWSIFGSTELITYWGIPPLYGLALLACLAQWLRGRGVPWLATGLTIATAGNWLDSRLFDPERTAGPSLLPLTLLAVLATMALRRRRR